MLKRLFTKAQTLAPIVAAIILLAAADAALAANNTGVRPVSSGAGAPFGINAGGKGGGEGIGAGGSGGSVPSASPTRVWRHPPPHPPGQ
jgi:hypothetical protein